MKSPTKLYAIATIGLVAAIGALGLAASSPVGAASAATAPAPQAAKPKIGVSIPAADHGWTAGVVWWAKECAKLHPDVDFTIATAESPEKQIEQIEALMAQKVDGLVILATESAPITPIAEEAHNRGILIVNVDRGFLKPVADIFIEGDNKAFGRKSAEFMVQKLGGKGKAKGDIIVLEGIPCTVNTDRVTAAMEVFKTEPGIKDREQRDDQGGDRDHLGISHADSVVDYSAEEEWLRHAEERRQDHRDQEHDHKSAIRTRIAQDSPNKALADLALLNR